MAVVSLCLPSSRILNLISSPVYFTVLGHLRPCQDLLAGKSLYIFTCQLRIMLAAWKKFRWNVKLCQLLFSDSPQAVLTEFMNFKYSNRSVVFTVINFYFYFLLSCFKNITFYFKKSKYFPILVVTVSILLTAMQFIFEVIFKERL